MYLLFLLDKKSFFHLFKPFLFRRFSKMENTLLFLGNGTFFFFFPFLLLLLFFEKSYLNESGLGLYFLSGYFFSVHKYI